LLPTKADFYPGGIIIPLRGKGDRRQGHFPQPGKEFPFVPAKIEQLWGRRKKDIVRLLKKGVCL
jgi:hypothetical protein